MFSTVERVRQTPRLTLTAPGILYKRAGFIALNRALRFIRCPTPRSLIFYDSLSTRSTSSMRADTNTVADSERVQAAFALSKSASRTERCLSARARPLVNILPNVHRGNRTRVMEQWITGCRHEFMQSKL